MDSFRRGDLVFDVRDTGPADGPVVVLLHGFPQTSSSWEAVTGPLVAEGFRCLAPDQRGYSPGARPPRRRDYRVAELVADVLALVDAAGAQRVHLVGHDWGAVAAWAFAATHPDRLASLTAVSVPHPAAFLRAVPRSRQALMSWYMAFFQLPVVPELLLTARGGRLLERFLEQAGQAPGPAARDARAMLDGGLDGGLDGRLRGGLGWYRALPLSRPGSLDVRVEVPTLFVATDGDVAISRYAVDTCARWVTGPYRLEVLTGVSHWVPDEAPEALTTLLLEHLRGHPA